VRGGRGYALSKRALDLFGAGAGLFFLWPVMLLVAFGVAVFLGRPVLFRQVRPGLNGRLFEVWKFRSMGDQRDADGNLLPDAQRLGRFGRLLRSSSLDELPQLFAVLKGDLSLVGPRPLLVEYLPYYSPEQARRHDVPPGITGWAQVNGRNALNWEQRFALDVWYVDHRSLALDLRILVLTVLKVFKREGITAAGGTMMPPFRGSEPGDRPSH
jgi:sugar transferase EpsL